MTILTTVGAVFFFALGCFLFFTGLKILWADSSEYERNRLRSGASILRIMKGDLPATQSLRRDYSVAHGLAFNTKTKKLEDRAKLSEESINFILRK